MRMIACVTWLAAIAIATAASAELRPADVFQDGMVLQRDRPIPVWGAAASRASVTVALGGQRVTARADEHGRWRAELPARAASHDPVPLRFESDGVVIEREALVGEVWLCSGQSNMEWRLINTEDAETVIALARDPHLRLFKVPHRAVPEPGDSIEATWEAMTPAVARDASAVAYYFGRRLRRELEVPVGLIQATWGGTPVEAWTSLDALAALPEAEPQLQRYKQAERNFDELHERYRKALAEYERQRASGTHAGLARDPGNAGEGKGYALPAFDDRAWERIELPARYDAIRSDLDGVVWYRRDVELPDGWAWRPLVLELGAIDDVDVTYFNGRRIGQTSTDVDGFARLPRRYDVPADVVRAGRAVIAVRVFDFYRDGGFVGDSSQMRLSLAHGNGDRTISLAGPWRYRVEHALDAVPREPGSRPTTPYGPGYYRAPAQLYNGMIHPLVPYAMRGVIWYQGESNGNRPHQYRSLFPAMIEDWRQRWGQGPFPFLFVQLANFRAAVDHPVDQRWAHLRDAQLHTLRTVPNTGMAVTIDIGDAGDIHPRNKRDVGERLARWALADVYGHGVVKSGPLVEAVEFRDGRAYVWFELFGSSLRTRDGERPRGFALAGDDRRWHWATGRIEGDTVVLESDAVPQPVAVRYAWADNPERANLVNAEDLPASPFRSDDWPGEADDHTR